MFVVSLVTSSSGTRVYEWLRFSSKIPPEVYKPPTISTTEDRGDSWRMENIKSTAETPFSVKEPRSCLIQDRVKVTESSDFPLEKTKTLYFRYPTLDSTSLSTRNERLYYSPLYPVSDDTVHTTFLLPVSQIYSKTTNVLGRDVFPSSPNE